MIKIKTIKISLVIIYVIYITTAISFASTLTINDVEPVGLSAFNDKNKLKFKIKNINKNCTLEWSLTGDHDDFNPLIAGKGKEILQLNTNFAELYFQLVKPNGNIIEMADLKFKNKGKSNDNIWDKLVINWNENDKSNKSKIYALNSTHISYTVATPIPGAIWLFVTGLFVLTGIRRRQL